LLAEAVVQEVEVQAVVRADTGHLLLVNRRVAEHQQNLR
jgi:hypothetical protein